MRTRAPEIALVSTPADREIASPKGAAYRADIQALRGLAVTLVVLYHAGLPGVQSGYLGVDIFFVISGFLITGIVARGLDASTFSFADFYARRARRLLPAAWLTLLVTTVLGGWLLTATRYSEYLAQLIGSSLFVANYVAWQQTGYFATDAGFRPLLHMWSLAIEEQYYLLLPLALWLLPKRWRLVGIALATTTSLALCAYMVERSPGVAFFFLPTRAWELGIGSIGALVANSTRVRHAAHKTLPAALLALLLVPLLPLLNAHPGANALVVCLATVAVLLAGSAGLARNPGVRALAIVGDFSYSLYLVHWPLLALARTVYLSKDLPPTVAGALVILSFVLALVMFRYVEEPFRHARIGGFRLAGRCIAAFAALLALGYALRPSPERLVSARQALAAVHGLPPSICRGDQPTYAGQCREPGRGHVLLWGDSYSMHLAPGLAATLDSSLDQASMGMCSPLLGYAALASASERPAAEACLRFTDSVLDYIRRTPTIRTVVLSARYNRTLQSGDERAVRRNEKGRIDLAEIGLAPTIAAQRRTVEAIRAMGRRVVVVSPTPRTTIDLGQCWERTAERKPILGNAAGCRITRSGAPALWRENDLLLAGFERSARVPVIRLDEALCTGGVCRSQYAGRPLFKDHGHLTELGSLYVGKRLDLGRAVDRLAR